MARQRFKLGGQRAGFMITNIPLRSNDSKALVDHRALTPRDAWKYHSASP